MELPRWYGGTHLPMQEIQEKQVQSLGREDPWRRAWQSIPVFLPGESHGQRSLVDCSPWGRKELGMTEPAHSMDTHGCVTGAEHDNMKERYKQAESDSGGDGLLAASKLLEN